MVCRISECNLREHGNDIFCILHTKNISLLDSVDSNDVDDYYSALTNYVKDFIKSKITSNAPDDEIIKTITSEVQENSVTKFLNENTIHFRDFNFPSIRSEEYYNYLSILERIRKPIFEKCSFHYWYYRADISNANFLRCTFHTDLFFRFKYEQTAKDPIFYNCQFDNSVNLESEIPISTKRTIFYDCKFKENIELVNINFDSDIFYSNFSNREYYIFSVANLLISNCTVNSVINLDNIQHSSLSVIDSTFLKKVSIEHARLNRLDILNCVFEEKFSLCFSDISEFKVKYASFNKIFDISDAKMGNLESFKPVRFISTTFSSHACFNGSNFRTGLEIDTSNIQSVINFHRAEIEYLGTSRETYRIIKNSFDSIGNYLEGNRYYAYELRSYYSELKYMKGYRKEKYLYFLNYYSSNFGQNYLLPIGWILLFGLIHTLLSIGYENNWLYQIQILNPIFSFLSKWLNLFASSLLPFGRFLREGMEFVSLVFYIIYVVLIWQTIVAVKRHSRR